MKILYTGIEDEGLTHGGEYEVLRPIPRPTGISYVVMDDNGTEVFIQSYNAQPIDGCNWCIGFCPNVTGDPYADYRYCPICGRKL